MNIPAGRIIQVDMGAEKWGKVVYLVINPPIVCETCDSVIFEWKSSQGQVICPACQNIIKERFYAPCPHCGDNDWMSLRVVNNNNFHYDSYTGEVTEYNDKCGRTLNVCGKSLEKEIKQGKVKLLSEQQSKIVKRKILWTGSDDYDPEKPMPDWIKDKF